MLESKLKRPKPTGSANRQESEYSKHGDCGDPFDVLKASITESILNGQTALHRAPAGLGKSRSVTMIADETAERFFIGTNLRDNYDEFEEWADKDGIPAEKLPTAADAEDVDPNETSWPISMVVNHTELPEQPRYKQQKERADRIRDKPASVLVGNPLQAHNPKNVEDRVVVLDENPFDPFVTAIEDPLDKAQEYADTFEQFPLTNVRRPEPGEQAKAKRAVKQIEAAGLDPFDYPDQVGEFHAKAPLIAHAILSADKLGNGLYFAEIPGDRYAVFDPQFSRMEIFDPPDLSGAKAVIGLDAEPCLPLWEAVIGNFEYKRLFDKGERNRHYQAAEGYEFRQLHDMKWSANTKQRLPSKDRAMAYLWEIEKKHDQKPDLITTRTFKRKIDDELYRNSLHFGDVKGRNDLKQSELLVVLGCPSLSDEHIKRWAALLGEVAEVATDDNGERLDGDELDYQNEVANAIYDSIKNRVFQAMLRAGRTDDVEATIYVGTNMIPDWLNITRVGRRIYSPDPNKSFDACVDLNTSHNSKRRAVIEALRDSDGMTAKEIKEEADVSRPTAKRHRESLRKDGYIRAVDHGTGKRTEFVDERLDDLNPFGTVDLSPMRKRYKTPKSSTYNNISGDLRGYARPSHGQSSDFSDGSPSGPYGQGWIYDIERRAEERKKSNLLRWRDHQDDVLPYAERRRRRSEADSDESGDGDVGWGTSVNDKETGTDDCGTEEMDEADSPPDPPSSISVEEAAKRAKKK